MKWVVALVIGINALGGANAAAQRPIASTHMTARRLALLNDVEGLSISPDGQWASFQVRRAEPDANRYVTEWRIVATGESRETRRIADAGPPILVTYHGLTTGIIRPAPAAWSPDSAWIAYIREDRGRIQVWRSRVDGAQTEQLTHNDGDVVSLVYSRDGSRIFFVTEPSRDQIDAALSEEGLSGFRFDRRFMPSIGARPVLPADGITTGEGRFSASQELLQRIWSYDILGRAERLATEAEELEFTALTRQPIPPDRPAFRENAARSPDGALVWTEARDPGRQGGYPPLTIVAQRRGARDVVCEAPQCTGQLIAGLWWRNEHEVIFVRREGSSLQDQVLYGWRPTSQSLRQIFRTADLFQSNTEWNCAVAQARRLVCFYEAPDRPRKLVAIDLDSGEVVDLFDPNPDFAELSIGPRPQRLEIRSDSGVETYGYLVLPPGPQGLRRLPLVIVTYRCRGFLRGGTGDEYPIFAFAAQGFAVLCFNAPDTDYAMLERMDWQSYIRWSRGLGDPEKHRVQEALDAVVSHLEEIGVVDPNNVGVTGLSFGAETVSFAMFNMPRLRAAIASGGEIGPSSAFLYGPIQRERNKEWGLGSAISPRWADLSLARNTNRVCAPLLLNVADHEFISQLEVVAALEEAGSGVGMYVFPDEYHIKWQPAHRLAIYERNIDWMNFWLRNVEDPNPSKVAQYQRWREMRQRTSSGAREPARRACRHD